MSTPVGLGLRLVRGPDWKWCDQDGGEGHVGTLVELGGASVARVAPLSPEGTVILQWDNGTRSNYRIGHQNAYDLRVIDNAPIGVAHKGVNCHSCPKSGADILGIRWNCSVCTSEPCNLCTRCYMGDKHDVNHEFFRIDQDDKNAVLVGKRSGSRRLTLRGLFPGAKVARGHDWSWKDQDGGAGKTGKLLNIQGWDGESGRSVANIFWPATGITNVYRVGHKGKVDVRIAPRHQAPEYGHYYPEHLPVLGKVGSVSVSLAQAPKNDPKTKFSKGDKVLICVNIDRLRQLQDGHGGFNTKMIEIIGKIGTVHRVTGSGDVRVQYSGSPESNHRWTIHPLALGHSKSFLPGQAVRIFNDESLVQSLQGGHGEWNPAMKDALGKVGTIVNSYADGDVRVNVIGNVWTFNPACLEPKTSSDASDASTVTYDEIPDKTGNHLEALIAEGDFDKFQRELSSLPDGPSDYLSAACNAASNFGNLEMLVMILEKIGEVNISHQGRSPLHIAAYQGHGHVIDVLVDKGMYVDCQDGDGDSPLHYAAFCKRIESMKHLLSLGANVKVKNKKGCTPLHVSVVVRHLEGVELILRQPDSPINLQDNYGDTPLHEAIVKDSVALEILCKDPKIDFKPKNHRGFNLLQFACLKGHVFAVQLILDRSKDLVNVPKEDGYTPLHLACLNGHEEVAKVLSKAGANLLAVDRRGQTPLHVAVHQGQASTIEFLLKENREIINVKGHDGDTALHVALSREGRPPNPATKDGSPTIFQLISKATSEGIEDNAHAMAIAAFLIVKGADLSIKNGKGHSAHDLVTDYMAKAFLLEFSCRPPEKVSRESSVKSEESGKGQDETVECPVCSEVVIPVKFIPCGHASVCEDCSSRMKKCIECKVVIEAKIEMVQNKDQESNSMEVTSPQPMVFAAMKAKLQDMEEQYTCTICMERKKSVAFSCGHTACCICAETLKSCHMCRKLIITKINLY